MKKIKVGVLFGSRSVEHEVSIVTAMEIFAALDKEKYEVTPIYINKNGKWYIGKDLDKLESYFNLDLKNKTDLVEYKMSVGTGINKDFDIIFPALHGAYGEDGTIQGLLEMMGIPYVGCGVTASAVGMDKVIQKEVFEKEGIPVVKYDWFMNWEYESNKEIIIKRLEKVIRYPMCIKPANLGSSIGINFAKNRNELEWAIQVAEEFDRKILIEEALIGIDEINCAVMGVDNLEASVCEQPIKGDKILSYDEKYLGGSKTKGMAGMTRLVPAPIKDKLRDQIQDYAKRAFRVIGASGVSRIDFLVNIKKGKIYINEINTMPGGVSFYLWEKSGYNYVQLLNKLIDLGFERFNKMSKLQRSFETKLLKSAKGGVKFGN
ncbi:MAG: D-alanine--D-alanine ligase [Candidatus Shapirobacteria bacterium]|nr:D-alanine--D-alanine ligase [Candidatus Shapirobacteria bacterium]MDD3002610.1 D-alanine--D-alanine ligase [Candidatus Shapirobacteria bacterium]MDD4382807.1 D-alanine--D-alanine ligase [Candidatus Shapirobacteria bacterium]